jgi:hypothetical protein
MADELISGASSPAYTLTALDVGRTLYCRVKATNVAGFASVDTVPVGPITPIGSVTPPVNTTPPNASVPSYPTQGMMASSTTGAWAGTEPITYSYQWVRYTVGPIAGAVSSTYILTAADVGFYVLCQVTATNAVGAVTVGSNALGPIAAISGGTAPSVITSPSIADHTPTEGSPLTCAPGSWAGDAPITFSYEWHRVDAPVEGVTGQPVGLLLTITKP